MAEPLFSVVIPTYNRAALVKRALESLVSQTYKNFEVIVCDDGSTDGTRDVVDSFKSKLNIRYIWEENWGGPARPRNNGVRAAQSDWICFLDSDDYCYPEKLENFRKYVNDYDVVYHDLVGVDVSEKSGEVRHPVFDNLLLADGNISLIPSSSCVRKSIIEKVGGIDETVPAGVEDYDLWLKIANVTDKFKHIPMRLGVYYLEDSNIHYNVFKMYKGIMQVYRKYESHPIGKRAIKKRQLHYFPYLAVFYKEEAVKILSSVMSFTPSFVTGCLFLLIPSFISKGVIRFVTKHFLKGYAYLVK